MIWLLLLLVPPLLYVFWELWKRPERQFTLYSSAGHWEKALPYARVLARRGGSGEVRGRRQMNLGTILARLEHWDEARVALEEALVRQDAAGDAYASLTRHTLALLELRRNEVGRARALAAQIAAGPEEFRGRARMLEAAAFLVEGKAADAVSMLAPIRAELVASKRPSDLATLAVLAVADPASTSELAAIIRERMPALQRRELTGQLPVLAKVL